MLAGPIDVSAPDGLGTLVLIAIGAVLAVAVLSGLLLTLTTVGITRHNRSRLAAADRVADADALLVALGAGDVEHPGGTLLAHLRRTHDVLVEMEADSATRLAGLCHAAYGTDGFAQSLLRLDDRDTLVEAIGAEAEALVHLYDSCHRRPTYARLGEVPLVLSDRFTGDDIVLSSADAAAFATITIANELDVLHHATLTPDERAGITQLFAALRPYAPDAAAFALART